MTTVRSFFCLIRWAHLSSCSHPCLSDAEPHVESGVCREAGSLVEPRGLVHFSCPYGLDKSTDIIRCAGLGRVCLDTEHPCMPAAVHSRPRFKGVALLILGLATEVLVGGIGLRVRGVRVLCALCPSVATKGPMWGYPRCGLGAVGAVLEPFCGHLSPKLDKVS